MNIKDMTPEQFEENGYRRGFDQGMYIVIKMLKDGKTLAHIEKKKDQVSRWRYISPKKRTPPPVQF